MSHDFLLYCVFILFQFKICSHLRCNFFFDTWVIRCMLVSKHLKSFPGTFLLSIANWILSRQESVICVISGSVCVETSLPRALEKSVSCGGRGAGGGPPVRPAGGVVRGSRPSWPGPPGFLARLARFLRFGAEAVSPLSRPLPFLSPRSLCLAPLLKSFFNSL